MVNRPGPEGAPPRCIAIAGPTAAGKTAAAMALARRFDAEIISVDSALVYRGMDIGTAKPSAAERAAVPHHLIDIREPTQSYNAAEFAANAAALIATINARARLALLVGGTMLYYRALFEGLDPMPATDPTVRARVAAQAQALGWPAMHARLATHDPATAARLQPMDAQRIGRALEVLEQTGQPLSAWHATKTEAVRDDSMRSVAVFSLEPQDRAWLHARIAERFDAMLAAGLLDELRALRARGGLTAAMPSMRCVGYRQAWDVLEGTAPLSELRNRGIFATRQLAKRQLTWLRGMSERRVIACDRPDAAGELVRQATAVLEGEK